MKKERMAKAFKVFNSGMKTRKQNEEEKQNKWLLQHDRCERSAEHAHFDILTICIWRLTKTVDIWRNGVLQFSMAFENERVAGARDDSGVGVSS